MEERFVRRKGSGGGSHWDPCKDLCCSGRTEKAKLDDATTLIRVVKIKMDCAEVQEELIILSVWRLKKQMQFIVDKGKVMNTGKSNSSCTHTIMGSKLAITM